MHEAASHLIVVGALEARTEQPELYLLGLVYTVWISRTLFRGMCLLEREKQYAEAIHYLTVLLEVTPRRHQQMVPRVRVLMRCSFLVS